MTANSENLEPITNVIRIMTANTENAKSRDAIIGKSFENVRNRNRQTHRRVSLIHLEK